MKIAPFGLMILLLTGCSRTYVATSNTSEGAPSTNSTAVVSNRDMKHKVTKSEDEWKKELSPEQFRVLRKKGTERAFTGEYWNNHEAGVYRCAGCGLELFASDTKFDSGTGWPSFYQPIEAEHVGAEEDNTLFARRTEVLCSRCGGHLGHVFEDGPKPTGLRYCINSAALKFEKK
jgi:peptide-methionine (R)-S-oxide reductase